MTVAANQPYFLPYLPYWQLIDCADLFLVCDDCAYMKGSWIPRNRILVNGRWQYFRIEIVDQSCHRLIKDTRMVDFDAANKLRTLWMAYHRAPCFNDAYEVLEKVITCPERGLSDFLVNSVRLICDYLGITTTIGFTSEVPGNGLLRREESIYHFCNYLGADTYVNATGGRALYSPSEFRAHGIELRFLDTRAGAYKQFGSGFVPGLSIVDAMMFVPREQLREMLDQRVLSYE